MDWKRLGKALLFPHIAIMVILIPVAAVVLIGSMVFIGTETVAAYISYVIAAYALTVWCANIPDIIRRFKKFKKENKYVKKWLEDPRLRVKMSLYGSLAWNTLYGVLQLWLGFYYRTFWFYSFGVYYICLAVMRFFLLRHTVKYAPGENVRPELVRYRACGFVFLLMNLALTLIIFFMVYFNRSFSHNMITAIALATYTFTAFTIAIINVIKYKKYNSPVFSAAKYISLAEAFVSMLTLEATMFTTFSDGTMAANEQKLMLVVTGGVISVLIVSMAIYMIVTGKKNSNN